MPYDLRRRLARQWDDTGRMFPEEADVWVSLDEAGYRYVTFHADTNDEEAPTTRDFTPLTTLYNVYLRHIRKNFDIENQFNELNIKQFGAAFRAITEHTLDRSQRWVMVGKDRKRLWGYAGVRGPGSHIVRLHRGKPSRQ